MNRRRFPRVNFPCLVILKEKGNERAILTHTENVSVSGVCVILKEEIKLFEVVGVEIDLMDFQPHVNCQGKVVWTVKRPKDDKFKPSFYDTGIELMKLDPKAKQRLEKIVQQLAKTQPTDN